MNGFFTFSTEKRTKILAYKGEYAFLSAPKKEYSFSCSRGFLTIKEEQHTYIINGFDSINSEEKKLLVDKITRLELISPFLPEIIEDPGLRRKFFKLAAEKKIRLAKKLAGGETQQAIVNGFMSFIAEKGNLELTKCLVERKETLASLPISKQLESYGQFHPFDMACKYGHLKIVKYLRDKISNQDIFKYGCLIACAYGQIKVVKYLFNYLSFSEEEMENMLLQAYYYKDLELARFLISQGMLRSKSGVDNFLYGIKYSSIHNYNDQGDIPISDKLEEAERAPVYEPATRLSQCLYLKNLIKKV